eukprot:NODE_1426_length_1964_cov_47.406301_g1207_i0.p1 GENE.NODE_1426_length_1964_cov_47.406301_g1207_i0~~NODE_1426_length_1964_cov_47.406301_g1207_i0.p1  ORF type:complete len:590 (-),score=145.00 NODE_1426_length_1964_cov_47.406301_g1207_i0:193-1746(-)
MEREVVLLQIIRREDAHRTDLTKQFNTGLNQILQNQENHSRSLILNSFHNFVTWAQASTGLARINVEESEARGWRIHHEASHRLYLVQTSERLNRAALARSKNHFMRDMVRKFEMLGLSTEEDRFRSEIYKLFLLGYLEICQQQQYHYRNECIIKEQHNWIKSTAIHGSTLLLQHQENTLRSQYIMEEVRHYFMNTESYYRELELQVPYAQLCRHSALLLKTLRLQTIERQQRKQLTQEETLGFFYACNPAIAENHQHSLMQIDDKEVLTRLWLKEKEWEWRYSLAEAFLTGLELLNRRLVVIEESNLRNLLLLDKPQSTENIETQDQNENTLILPAIRTPTPIGQRKGLPPRQHRLQQLTPSLPAPKHSEPHKIIMKSLEGLPLTKSSRKVVKKISSTPEPKKQTDSLQQIRDRELDAQLRSIFYVEHRYEGGLEAEMARLATTEEDAMEDLLHLLQQRHWLWTQIHEASPTNGNTIAPTATSLRKLLKSRHQLNQLLPSWRKDQMARPKSQNASY